MSLTIEGGAAPALEPAETVTQPVKSENSAPESTVKQENNNSTLAKAGELQFSGAYMAARVDRQQPVPVTTPLSTTGTAAGTQATYQVGPPARPNIRHDNGFLQNPNNPNDPKPMPTRAPTDAERSAYNTQVFKANAGRIAQFVGYLPDGIENYRHFLTGNGADHKFSYDKFVSDDKSGQTVLKNAIGDTQKGAEEIYRQMVAKDPSLANKPVTFQITGSQIGVGSGNRFPYPATENWQKAIGGHSIWNSAQVTVTPPNKPGGQPTYKMQYKLHGEDRYNFNPNQQDIATGQPDSDNGRFEVSGLARQFTNYATLQRNVSWVGGKISGTTSVNQNR